MQDALIVGKKGGEVLLKNILEEEVKIINYIQTWSPSTYFLNKMGSTLKTLLLHIKVQWPSQGKSFGKLFELLASHFL